MWCDVMLTNVAKFLNSIHVRPPDPQCAVFDFKDDTTTFQLITEKSMEATPGVFWVQLHRLPRFERFQSVTSWAIPRSISQSDSIGNNCCLTNSVLYPSLLIPVLSCSIGPINEIICIKSYEREILLLLLCPAVLPSTVLCLLSVFSVLWAVYRSSLLDYPTVLTLFILCSSIFSTLLQAPVNCWTDFFSFLPWIRHIFLAAKIKINFFVVCGWEFSSFLPRSAVGSGKGGGYTSRSPLLSRSRWKIEGGPTTCHRFSFFGFLKFCECLCSMQ